MLLLDGVKNDQFALSKEAQELSKYVKDSNLSLVDRLECFEDIMNIEIGDTNLTRSRSIERTYDLRQVFVKFEGNNPTGTQKDRIAFAQVHDALRRDFRTISVATCGNYGSAIAFAAFLGGLECKIFIPETYHTSRVTEMEKFGAQILRHPGSYEDTVWESIRMAEANEWYDANPGGANTPLQIRAYAQIADEIYDVLRDAPKMVAVPVSNGTLLAGIHRGFMGLYKRGKTSRIPKLIAGSSSGKNPIIQSFKKGLDHCEDLDPHKIKETEWNEPLINWHSFDGEEAIYALRESQGEAFNISDAKLLDHSQFLAREDGLNVLPASTAGLAALLNLHAKNTLEPDRYVAIITAKK
ncbi:MAG: pyridoxal-phosphate dependent enzyme [Saprospirales bacterium]|nr:pyridoxal-phosphate dependent enzyme [Saprospirales bacterium]MBK8489767.1 pyridoxal-phosphate dependent enzyme [Saprospirales bacterium]